MIPLKLLYSSLRLWGERKKQKVKIKVQYMTWFFSVPKLDCLNAMLQAVQWSLTFSVCFQKFLKFFVDTKTHFGQELWVGTILENWSLPAEDKKVNAPTAQLKAKKSSKKRPFLSRTNFLLACPWRLVKEREPFSVEPKWPVRAVPAAALAPYPSPEGVAGPGGLPRPPVVEVLGPGDLVLDALAMEPSREEVKEYFSKLKNLFCNLLKNSKHQNGSHSQKF